MAAFIKNIRHGRPAPTEVVDEVIKRFNTIGGSPLMRITHEQAAALEARLGVPVRASGRLWHPYPDAVLGELAQGGARDVVSLPLAPQSVHVYHAAVEKAAADLDLTIHRTPAWGLEPALIDAFVTAVDEARSRFDDVRRDAVPIVLTAHSLPLRVIEGGDPYARDFEQMAAAVAEQLRPNNSIVAYQSQGMGGGDWLGPALEETLRSLREQEHDDVLIAPVGFVAEHVETLYDIDIEARALADELGFVGFERMPAMNTRARFIDALENVARPILSSLSR